MNTAEPADLAALLHAVADDPRDRFLCEVTADCMEEAHGHRNIEPFLPYRPLLSWNRWGRSSLVEISPWDELCVDIETWYAAYAETRNGVIRSTGVPAELLRGTPQLRSTPRDDVNPLERLWQESMLAEANKAALAAMDSPIPRGGKE